MVLMYIISKEFSYPKLIPRLNTVLSAQICQNFCQINFLWLGNIVHIGYHIGLSLVSIVSHLLHLLKFLVSQWKTKMIVKLAMYNQRLVKKKRFLKVSGLKLASIRD